MARRLPPLLKIMVTKLLNKIRDRRSNRVRARINGTVEKPRLSIFRSNKYLYAQLIDDSSGKTLMSFSTLGAGKNKSHETKVSASTALGKAVAAGMKHANLTVVIFDRGRYAYHGRVRAVAEALREEGIKV